MCPPQTVPLKSRFLLIVKSKVSKNNLFLNCVICFQVKKSLLTSLGVDLDHNASDAKLLFDHFILGVKPTNNGSDPRTSKDVEKYSYIQS